MGFRRGTPTLQPLLLLVTVGLLQPSNVFSLSEAGLPQPVGISPSPGMDTTQAPSGTPFEETRLHVFTLDYPHVQVPFEITLWILLASLAKIGK